MRIALDATYTVDPHPSGIAVYSHEILNGLAASHPEDRFLHCYRPKQFLESDSSAAANVKRRVLLPGLPLLGKQVDVFHALNQRIDRRVGRKAISTFHDLFVISGDYSSAEFRRRFTLQARRAAENSDLIIAVSQFTANEVCGLLHVEPARLRVVHHGVHSPAAHSKAPREKLILFVGALQVRKNISRLVEAFEAVPADWQLVLAGAPSGFGADGILAKIDRSPARARITVSGYVHRSELELLYSRAAIFAFPSLAEGFGMPVLEAMARGVPVLTSNNSALPEVAGDAAVLVDPEDADEMAGELADLAKDPGRRERLSELGLKRAAAFSWERSVAATYAVYREA